MVFISVADAVERTGKGQTTIYRLCRKHEHTKHVKREDKRFLIDEELLSRHFPEAISKQVAPDKGTASYPTPDNYYSRKEDTPEATPAQPRPELIDLFIDELLEEKRYYRQLLEKKEEQLIRKDNIIASLQERQKELYYLLNHQTSLLERPARSAPKENPASPAHPPKEAGIAGQQHSREEDSTEKKKVPMEGVAVPEAVYYVLAFVALLLTLAIVYVDEIRALTE